MTQIEDSQSTTAIDQRVPGQKLFKLDRKEHSTLTITESGGGADGGDGSTGGDHGDAGRPGGGLGSFRIGRMLSPAPPAAAACEPILFSNKHHHSNKFPQKKTRTFLPSSR